MNMPGNTPKPTVSLDVAARAEAKLDIKAEVPASSAGRLVDALTDIIRPFTEARGLRADQIRLQREDVLIEIARKARIRAEIEGVCIGSIPTKFLVPFLEKASLEDLNSDLCEAWPNLLVEAARNFDPKLSVYIDILSKISGSDVKFLHEVCLASNYRDRLSWPLGHFADNEGTLRANIPLLDQSTNIELSENAASSTDLWLRFKSSTKLQYGFLIHASVLSPAGALYFYNSDIAALDGLTVDRLAGQFAGRIEPLERKQLF
jgi:hypothetical protein